ncbi:MAG: glycosyltransferase family 4 protein [Verrucomicrobiota bacterium]
MLHIALIEPNLASRARGNAVTVRRWKRSLEKRGHRVDLLRAGQLASSALDGVDLLHAHHAFRSGPSALEAATSLGRPLVVSLGGSDIRPDSSQQFPAESRRILQRANAILGPTPRDEAILAEHLEEPFSYHRVRRGVSLPHAFPSVEDKSLRALHLGGIREMKGQDIALDWWDALLPQELGWSLTFAGPTIEPAYAASFQERIERPNLQWLGEVSPQGMIPVFAQSDFLLHSSRFEGAPNAVLEAWTQGRPVVARRAYGVEAMITSAPESIRLMLSANSEEAVVQLREWLSWFRSCDRPHRERIAKQARDHVYAHHDAEDEARELETAYYAALGRT